MEDIFSRTRHGDEPAREARRGMPRGPRRENDERREHARPGLNALAGGSFVEDEPNAFSYGMPHRWKFFGKFLDADLNNNHNSRAESS